MFLSIFIAVIPFIHNAQELHEQLPMTESAVEALSQTSLAQFQEELTQFLVIPEEERTFDNTIRAWDFLNGNIKQTLSCLHTLLFVHPEKNMRDCLDTAYQNVYKTYNSTLAAHPEIYAACQSVKKASPLLTEQNAYYLNELLIHFKLMGMQLPDSERSLFAKTQEEIQALKNQFSRNVAEDSSILYTSKEDLEGLDTTWISQQKQNENGAYCLSCDLSNYMMVMTRCSNRKTRQAMHELFTNRAYPQNEDVIVQLIAKKDALAKLLGFPSYASYELTTKMARAPENVETFLSRIKQKISLKTDYEFKKINEELPPDIALNSSGQLEYFDQAYAYNAYKKKHFSVNEEEIAQFFPLDKTLAGLLQIYAQFFDLTIQEAPHQIPIPNLKAVEVRNSSGELLGVILLDLFTRKGKNSHSGICCPIIPPYSPVNGPNHPASCLVICNFAPSSTDHPTLLTHKNATSLFHEFGHAIHFILARNELLSFCGFNVKWDFVELPSVLLEKWLLDPEILKRISSHYLTGEPLPDTVIQNMIKAQNFSRGAFMQRQCCLSEMSLALFAEGATKKPGELCERIWAQEMPLWIDGSNSHFHASWWHIPNYGPNYYAYVWSSVFACDLFEKIQQEGLLNPKSGLAYSKAILSKGGSQDPMEMLTHFLGRAPSEEPFLKQLDIE